MANAIDWKQISAPDFSGSNSLLNQGQNTLLQSLALISKTAKDYGDTVSERNTNDLLMRLQQAATPEEFDSTAKTVMGELGSLNNNYDSKTLMDYMQQRPQQLTEQQLRNLQLQQAQNNVLDTPMMAQALQSLVNGNYDDAAKIIPQLRNTANLTSITEAVLGRKDKKFDQDNVLRDDKREDLKLNNETIKEANEQILRLAQIRALKAGGGNDSGGSGDGSDKLPVLGATTLDPTVSFGDNGFDYSGINIPTQNIVGRESTIKYLLNGGANSPLAGKESSNGKDIYNSVSGATGNFQFIGSTLEDTVNSNPQLKAMAGNRTGSQLMDYLKQNPQFEQAAAEVEMNRKIDSLEKAGIPVNPSTVAGAWQAGQGSFIKIYKAAEANPNIPINSVLESVNTKVGKMSWTASQGYPDNMTVGEFINQTSKKIGVSNSGGQPAKKFSREIPVSEINTLATEFKIDLAKLDGDYRKGVLQDSQQNLEGSKALSAWFANPDSSSYGLLGNRRANLHGVLKEIPEFNKLSDTQKVKALEIADNVNLAGQTKIPMTGLVVGDEDKNIIKKQVMLAIGKLNEDHQQIMQNEANTLTQYYTERLRGLAAKYGGTDAGNKVKENDVIRLFLGEEQFKEGQKRLATRKSNRKGKLVAPTEAPNPTLPQTPTQKAVNGGKLVAPNAAPSPFFQQTPTQKTVIDSKLLLEKYGSNNLR